MQCKFQFPYCRATGAIRDAEEAAAVSKVRMKLLEPFKTKRISAIIGAVWEFALVRWRSGQGTELAASIERADLYRDAVLLAQDKATIDPADRTRIVAAPAVVHVA